MPLDSGVRAIVSVIDRFTILCARVFAWMSIVLMLAIVWHVVARYIFQSPTIWAYDVTYMLYGSMFMLGSAYCLYRGGHIRTDFLYRTWSPRWQGGMDATLYVILFFPAMWLFFEAGFGYAERSWIQGERGFYSPWAPPIYPFKTVIPVAIVLLMIQGVSELLKSLYAAIVGRWPE